MKRLIILLAVAVVLAGVIWWFRSAPSPDSDIISSTGLHWHPVLEIYVKGEKQVIPANIGIGGQFSSQPMGMAPVHTHDDADQGIIHLEFNGIVREKDIMLGEFFRSWGKDINSFGSSVQMTVNGVPSMELGSHLMHDGDKIVLRYE